MTVLLLTGVTRVESGLPEIVMVGTVVWTALNLLAVIAGRKGAR